MMGALSLGLRGRLSGASAVALLGLSLACAAVIVPAEADKVGVAAAVNPDAFSSLAGSPQSQLSIGKSIFYNERINTTGSGLVQVLLVDGSTFTVGPGSDLVIDKFVYDPKKGTGQIAASFSKGVMRFVGGKLSKNDGGVTVDTPAGALAIRGGVGFMDFKSATNYSVLFVFGEYMKMAGKTLYMPGYGWFMNNGQFNTRQFDANDLKTILAALTNSSPNPTPSDPPKPKTLTTILNTQSLNQLISDANTTMIVDKAQEAEQNLQTDNQQPPPCEVDCGGSPTGHIQGYAGGLYAQNSVDHEGDAPVGVLANRNSTYVDFTLPQTQTQTFSSDYQLGFSALFQLSVGAPWDPDQGGANIHFGAPDFEGFDYTTFAYGNFFGLTTNVEILGDNGEPHNLVDTPYALLASSGWFVNLGEGEGVLPENLEFPQLCTDCTFVNWGVLGMIASFEDPDPEHPQQVAVLDWFVAGDIPAVGQLPFTGNATYVGTALGTVATNLFDDGLAIPGSDGWTTYVATGDMEMSWNFGTRKGDFEISNFDAEHFTNDGGLTFGGPMCAPGVTSGCGQTPDGAWKTPDGNHFGGPLKLTNASQLPTDLKNQFTHFDGFALGSFVRGPTNYIEDVAINGSTPQGVIGNWAIGSDRYMASGIFAGAKQ